MENFFDKKSASRMGKTLLFLAVVALLYVGMKFVNETRAFSAASDDVSKMTTIDVTGTGDAFAIPDIANISFSISENAATIQDAQATVTQNSNTAVAFLKSSGIDQKDIQTTDYSANPEYSYPTPCISGKKCETVDMTPKLIGYTVSETMTVKIRDTSVVGTIVDGLGTRGVTGITGPNFTVDSPDAVNAQARAVAIANAQAKADVLAKQLGIKLVRVVRFSEDTGTNPMPMFAKAMDVSASASAPVAPSIQIGQNKYTSNVTLTYEIE